MSELYIALFDGKNIAFSEREFPGYFLESSDEAKAIYLKVEQNKRLEELQQKYIDSQRVYIINGISFSAILQGDWYNMTLEKRKNAAKSRLDKLCYICIPAYKTGSEAEGQKQYEGVMPLAMVETIDAIWDEISLQNWRIKVDYTTRINNAQNIDDLAFNISFLPIQHINLNYIAIQMLNDLNVDFITKEFITSKQIDDTFHFFTEFDTSKHIAELFQ